MAKATRKYFREDFDGTKTANIQPIECSPSTVVSQKNFSIFLGGGAENRSGHVRLSKKDLMRLSLHHSLNKGNLAEMLELESAFIEERYTSFEQQKGE